MSWLFDPNFLIYKLEDELIDSKKQHPKVPSWKRDCQQCNKSIFEIYVQQLVDLPLGNLRVDGIIDYYNARLGLEGYK